MRGGDTSFILANKAKECRGVYSTETNLNKVIINISPCSTYTEGWGYQDNLLPKYQAKLGFEVHLIADTQMHSNTGPIDIEPTEYMSKDGFRVYRLNRKRIISKRITGFLAKIDVYELLKKIKPDLIFFHGLVSITIFQAVKYKREINPECIIVQDNHLDWNIGRLDSMKLRSEKRFYRYIYHLNDKYISRVYGVTPWRKEYAEKVFGVPQDKADVLIMGADDDEMHIEEKLRIREEIRKMLGVNPTQFLIVTGGKVDRGKRVIELMRAVNGMGTHVRLVIFGKVLQDVETQFKEQLSEKVTHVGWIESKDVYKYFYASDLVFFPGQHSVLWEQACAAKVPCVFKKWPGMNHVDNGGNSCFIEDSSEVSIQKCIDELVYTKKYHKMKAMAESHATDIYLYSNIARKSVECLEINDKYN